MFLSRDGASGSLDRRHGHDFEFTQIGLFSVPSAGQHDEPPPPKRPMQLVQGQVVQPTAGA